MSESFFFHFFFSQDRDSDSTALCVKNRSSFEHQHHHLLHCLEKTTVSFAVAVTLPVSCSKGQQSSIVPLIEFCFEKSLLISNSVRLAALLPEGNTD